MMSLDSWCSPPEVADPLADMFGGPVDVDPCSNNRSIIKARLSLTRGGLVCPWVFPGGVNRTVYENEPYSQSDAWTDKTLREIRSGNVLELVRLTMFSCSSVWWSRMCSEPERNPRILALKRLKFLDPESAVVGAVRQTCRFEPAMFYVGPNVELFDKTFKHLARWSAWGR